MNEELVKELKETIDKVKIDIIKKQQKLEELIIEYQQLIENEN